MSMCLNGQAANVFDKFNSITAIQPNADAIRPTGASRKVNPSLTSIAPDPVLHRRQLIIEGSHE